MPKEAKSYGIRDMYRIFLEDHPKLDIPFVLFKEIINANNKLATAKVLGGGTYNFGFRLSEVYIKRVKREYKLDENGKLVGAAVDHHATKKLRDQGILKTVYHTDPYYFRWAWKKSFCTVPGKVVYQFRPTQGVGGTKTMLKKLLKNPLNHVRFAHEHYKQQTNTQPRLSVAQAR